MPYYQSPSAPVTARSLVRTALPFGAFYLAEILVGLTDLAVVGSLGTVELAAVGLSKTILLSVMAVGFATLSIGAVLMAEGSDPHRCGVLVAASMVLTLPFTAIAVLIAQRAGPVLLDSGYDAAVVDAFGAYACVLAWAIAPALLFAALKNVLNAVGRTRAIAWLAGGVVVGNLVGSIVLVHGIGSWNGLGVTGAAWATLIVNAVAAAALLEHALRSGFVRFDIPRAAPVLQAVVEIVRLGWAAGAQQVLESVLFIAVLYLLGLRSVEWLAAGTVVFAVMELNFAMSAAVGEVLSVRVAATRAAGGGGLVCLARLGMGISGAAAALLALAVGVFAEVTVSVFAGAEASAEARGLMIELLRWTAPFFLLDAWQIVFIHVLRGLRRTVLPMVLSTGCYWAVGLGGGLILAEPLGFGAPGTWVGFCVGLTCAAGLLAVMAFQSAERIDKGA